MPLWEKSKKALAATRWFFVEKAKPFLGETLSQSWQAVVKVFTSPFVRKKSTQIVSEGWQGTRATLRWYDLTKLLNKPEAKPLRERLAGSFRANIVYYAGPVLLYSGWIKPLILRFAPGFAATAVFGGINSAVGWLFFSLWMGALLKNIYYTMSIGIEAEKIIKPDRLIKEGCDESKLEYAKADFDSMICYPRNLITAAVVSRCAPGPVGTLIYAAAYGQNLVEFRFASVGMCGKHRVQLFRENNPYVLAHGFSLLLTAKLATEFLCMFTPGIDDPHVGTAIFDFIFQIYLIFSLMNDDLLPGKEGRYEPFMINRFEMTFWKEQANELIEPQADAKAQQLSVYKQTKMMLRGALVKIGLRSAKKPLDASGQPQDNLITFVKGFAGYPPIRLLIFLGLAPGLYYPNAFIKNPRVMFSAKIFSPEVLLTIPELAELVKMHSDGIQFGVSVTKWARSTSFLVAYIPSWIVPVKFANAFTSLGNLDPVLVSQIESLPMLVKRLEAPTQEEETKLDKQVELDEKHVVQPGFEPVRVQVRCETKIDGSVQLALAICPQKNDSTLSADEQEVTQYVFGGANGLKENFFPTVQEPESPDKAVDESFVFCDESKTVPPTAKSSRSDSEDGNWCSVDKPSVDAEGDDWLSTENPLAYSGKPLAATRTAASPSLRDAVSHGMLQATSFFVRRRPNAVPGQQAVKTVSQRPAQLS